METDPEESTVASHPDWMSALTPKLTYMPIKHLAIPGSHDSFSFYVDPDSPVGPDQKALVKNLVSIFSQTARKFLVKWCITQTLTFPEQLDAGVRYFDLRVSTKPGDEENDIYFLHGLFGHKVRDCLVEINAFLNEHKKEVVFLDFNHYYDMNKEHHAYLIKMLQEVFGGKLCRQRVVEEITLNYMWEKKFQVLVFYHDPAADGFAVMWPGTKIPAPWANTTQTSKLTQFLETTLKERGVHGSFHVTQAILSPKFLTVATGLVSGLRGGLVERNLPAIMAWIDNQRPGPDGVNIITSDFVELNDFTTTIIKLNQLLLSAARK